MELPVFAPYPPAAIRSSFPADEWKRCLEAWTILAAAYLRTDDKTYKQCLEQKSFIDFLRSFYEQWKHTSNKADTSIELDKLANQCFSLVARCSNSNSRYSLFADLEFLSYFARAHVKNSLSQKLLAEIWSAKSSPFPKALQKWKTTTMTDLEHGSLGQTSPSLSAITPLLFACGDAAAFLMTGSDFLEAITASYSRNDKQTHRRALVLVTYIGLTSLVRDGRNNSSVLSDHVYSLKAHAEGSSSPSLLHDLVTNTPILKAMKRYLSTSGASERTKHLAETLVTFQAPSIARKRAKVRRQAKGKGRVRGQHQGVHLHRISLVSQIQDLFPHLGAGFVMKLLDEYEDNVEEVTAHLLDESLPSHLSGLDRSEPALIHDTGRRELIDQLAPRSTPPLPEAFIPHRANIFDDDDFDRLEVDTSKLHIGKKEHKEESTTSNKAAILSALAAFDADDDERDDTYDIEDVGGTVDGEHHDGDNSAVRLAVEENDMILYRHYQSQPEAFGRSAETRRSNSRATLKSETGMTDEAIEGWAIMLQRDPKRANRLATEATSFNGRQTQLARTAYREQAGDTETEDSDTGAHRGGFGGRGRVRGRGRGGNVAGPSNEASTAAAQRRKEANKSSRANHNRRNQRAKKMARGGFAGAS